MIEALLEAEKERVEEDPEYAAEVRWDASRTWRLTYTHRAIAHRPLLLPLQVAAEPEFVNISDENGITPLMLVCQYGELESVKLLLEYKADALLRSDDDTDALMFACRDGHHDTVGYLLSKEANLGLDINRARRVPPSTALGLAASYAPPARSRRAPPSRDPIAHPASRPYRYGHTPTAKLLLQHRADPDGLGKRGRSHSMAPKTPISLMHGSSANDLIRKESMSIDEETGEVTKAEQRTPLMRACQFGYFETCALLIKEKADVNNETPSGGSPLFFAAHGGHDRCVNLLLQEDAGRLAEGDRPPTGVHAVRKKDHYQPLMVAAAYGHPAVCNALLANDADVNYRRPRPFFDTALMRASKFGRPEAVQVLLDRRPPAAEGAAAAFDGRPDGAPEAVNLTLHDGEGRQALHLAAENGHAECVRMLVMAGGAAHANARVAGGEQGHALKGRTALMMACDKGHEKVVRVLLHTEKLDLDAKCDDENGPKTAEDYARAHSETKHLAALIEAKRKERAQKEGPGSP